MWARQYLEFRGLVAVPRRQFNRITHLGLELVGRHRLPDGSIDTRALAASLPIKPQKPYGARTEPDANGSIEDGAPNTAETVEPATPLPDGTAGVNGSVTARSFVDAAEYVLERFGVDQPMHYREITRKILELGLVPTQGQTPERTLYAQVLNDVARRERLGEAPRFVRHGKGIVGLTKGLPAGLAMQIEQHNAEVRMQLLARLHIMPPGEFELLIGALLDELGFVEVVVTGRSGDGGIDVRGTLVVGDVIRTQPEVPSHCQHPKGTCTVGC